MESHTIHTEKGQATLVRVQEELQVMGNQGVGKIVELINGLAANAFSISIQDLAELIARDSGIAKKVIKAANTMGYNPQGIEIETIGDAIHIIGFRKIRNLAISLLLVEHAESSGNSQEYREITGMAVASGLFAQSVREQSGLKDPDQAFVCAMLRHYGRMLMAYFLCEEYQEAETLSSHMTTDEAYRKVFGLTPLELSYTLLLSADLPKEILHSLEKIPREVIEKATRNPRTETLALASFSERVCELMNTDGLSQSQFETSALELAKEYGHLMDITPRIINKCLKETASRVKVLNRIAGAEEISTRIFVCLDVLAEGKDRVPPTKKKNVSVAGSEPAPLFGATESQAAAKPYFAENPWNEGIVRLQKLNEHPPVDLIQAFHIAISAMHDGLQLDHSIAFVRNRNSTSYSCKAGEGVLASSLMEQTLIDTHKVDIFQSSLIQGCDVIIENPCDASEIPLLPNFLRSVGIHHRFYIYPIREGERTPGLLFGAQLRDKALPDPEQVRPKLASLRFELSKACRRSR